jgi:hypothetical protein
MACREGADHAMRRGVADAHASRDLGNADALARKGAYLSRTSGDGR